LSIETNPAAPAGRGGQERGARGAVSGVRRPAGTGPASSESANHYKKRRPPVAVIELSL